MKNIQLRKLELTNYRNIEFASYEFDGNSKIIGENRIGKTNTLESIYWLLTDKLLDGSSDAQAIKPLKDTKLEVRVKAVFDVDGKQITLEKTYKENWVKTRGTTDIELKGHTVTLFYNDVKQPTLRAYNQLVSADFGFEQDANSKIDFTQMLTNPFYLGNVGESKDWTELRAFIIKLVGDVNDEDVIKANPELNIIKDDLQTVGGRIDQLKKRYVGEISSLKDQIIGDESQIKMLEETQKPSDDEIALAQKGIQEHEDEIATLKGSNTIDTMSMAIYNDMQNKKIVLANLEKQDAIENAKNNGSNEYFDKLNELRSHQSELIEKKSSINNQINIAKYDASSYERRYKELSDERKRLVEEYKEIDKKIANPVFETACPHCGRPYEQDKLDELQHNAQKTLVSEKLKVTEKGKEVKTMMDEADAKRQDAESKVVRLEEDVRNIEIELKAVEGFIQETKNKLETPSQTVKVVNPKIDELKAEIVELEHKYYDSRDKFAKGIQDINQAIYEHEEAMKPFKEVIANEDYYNRQMLKLTEVKEYKAKHMMQLADSEQKKESLNTFMLKKLKMLDGNVSKVFGKIRFQLIKENINGGYDPICKPYIYDTEANESTSTGWKSGSKSERVVTGIAITEAIKAALNLPNLPYLFDEGGEISTETFARRFKTESQIICVKIADNIPTPMVQKL